MNASISEESGAAISGSLTELRDELLVSAAKAGDCSAFVELCERHTKKLLPGIYRITQNREDAEDVLQESLLKAFLNLKTFEGRSSFASWLTRIAINSALMLLRKRRGVEISIDNAGDGSLPWLAWEPWDKTESPEALFAQREKEALLRRAILRLPATFREVMELRHAYDYSTTEIARILGISVSAVKSRLSRGRVAMRASLRRRHRHHEFLGVMDMTHLSETAAQRS